MTTVLSHRGWSSFFVFLLAFHLSGEFQSGFPRLRETSVSFRIWTLCPPVWGRLKQLGGSLISLALTDMNQTHLDPSVHDVLVAWTSACSNHLAGRMSLGDHLSFIFRLPVFKQLRSAFLSRDQIKFWAYRGSSMEMYWHVSDTSDFTFEVQLPPWIFLISW